MKPMQAFIAAALLISLSIPVAAWNGTGQPQTGKGKARRTKHTRPKSKVNPPATGTVAATTPSGLIYVITRHGSGRLPLAGETVMVNYTGVLGSGMKFDSSLDHGRPYEFKLGFGRVIKGWDEGIAKLHVGDQATLIVPPQLGYGVDGAGGGVIPPNATLIFLVELVGIKEDAATPTPRP
jgi:peptidylprolyl isomerase